MQHALVSPHALRGLGGTGIAPRCTVRALHPGVLQVSLSKGALPFSGGESSSAGGGVTAVLRATRSGASGSTWLSFCGAIGDRTSFRILLRRAACDRRRKTGGPVAASMIPPDAVSDSLQVLADPSVGRPVFDLAADIFGSSDAVSALLAYLLPLVEENPDTVTPYIVTTIAGLGYASATPSALLGFVDFVSGPIHRPQRYSPKEVKVGRQMGEGNFGVVYEGFFSNGKTGREQKWEKHVVLKRVKPRVEEAEEMRDVELYMNHRVARAAPGISAAFLGTMLVEEGQVYGKLQEGLWLVWNYQGDRTLETLLQSRNYPNNIARNLLGKELPDKRGSGKEVAKWVEWEVAQVVIRQILTALKSLHRAGIVHRDVKPSNLILDEVNGKFCLIDLGACVDLRTGHNFVPNETVMDPKYAAPERFVMPPGSSLPYPPDPLASLVSPLVWALNTPDRFDLFSAGIVFMQLCVKQLRYDPGLSAFNKDLKKADYDLEKWRKSQRRISNAELAVLDAHNGAGWDLVRQLLRKRHNEEDAVWPGGFLGEGRPSATQALNHRFFSLSVPEEYRRYAGLVDVAAKKAARKEAAAKAKASGPQPKKGSKKGREEDGGRKGEGAVVLPTVSGPLADALGAVVMAATGVTQSVEDAPSLKGKNVQGKGKDVGKGKATEAKLFSFLSQPKAPEEKNDAAAGAGSSPPKESKSASPRKAGAEEEKEKEQQTGFGWWGRSNSADTGSGDASASVAQPPKVKGKVGEEVKKGKEEVKGKEEKADGMKEVLGWWGGRKGGEDLTSSNEDKGEQKGKAQEMEAKKVTAKEVEDKSVKLKDNPKKEGSLSTATDVRGKKSPEDKKRSKETAVATATSTASTGNGAAFKNGAAVSVNGATAGASIGQEAADASARHSGGGWFHSLFGGSSRDHTEVSGGDAEASTDNSPKTYVKTEVVPVLKAEVKLAEEVKPLAAGPSSPFHVLAAAGGALAVSPHEVGSLVALDSPRPKALGTSGLVPEILSASKAGGTDVPRVGALAVGRPLVYMSSTGATQQETARMAWAEEKTDGSHADRVLGEGEIVLVREGREEQEHNQEQEQEQVGVMSPGVSGSGRGSNGKSTADAIGAREETPLEAAGGGNSGEGEQGHNQEPVRSPIRYISALVDLYFGGQKAKGDSMEEQKAEGRVAEAEAGSPHKAGTQVLADLEQDVGQLSVLGGGLSCPVELNPPVPGTTGPGISSTDQSADTPLTELEKDSFPTPEVVIVSADAVTSSTCSSTTTSSSHMEAETKPSEGQGSNVESAASVGISSEVAPKEGKRKRWEVPEEDRSQVEAQLRQLEEKYAQRDEMSRTLQDAVAELDQQIVALELSVRGGRTLANEQKRLLQKLESLLREDFSVEERSLSK